jgi:formate dehydrogenase subunit gamma
MPSRILRFTLSERIVHWLVAAAFATMLLSGTQVPRHWGLSSGYFDVHIGAAIVLAGGLLGIMLVGNGRALRRTAVELTRLDPLDRRWLQRAPAHMLAREQPPPAGRFNGGQKINAQLSWIGLAILYASGIAVTFLGNSPPENVIHSGMAVAMTVLIAGHVYMAVLNPATRHALRGMTVGDVDRSWARDHHPRWTELSEAEPAGDGEH